MYRVIFLIAAIFLYTLSYSQDILPQGYIIRTFNIQYNSKNGTTFLIEYKDKNYFVTARHLFHGTEKDIIFSIAQNKGWQSLQGTVRFHSNSLVDIAVIEPSNFGKTGGIKMDPAEITLGDNGFFLGFPYGFQTLDNSNLNLGFPFPLIKRANFSGATIDNNVFIMLLDGHNNPGFSGGPVFFRKRANPSDQDWYLAGVISAYVYQRNKLVTPLGELEFNENSGIIVVIDARHIIEIIESIK